MDFLKGANQMHYTDEIGDVVAVTPEGMGQWLIIFCKVQKWHIMQVLMFSCILYQYTDRPLAPFNTPLVDIPSQIIT